MDIETQKLKLSDEIRMTDNINDLMDSVGDGMVRKDLVYTLILKAWDIGYVDGIQDEKNMRADKLEL